LTFNTSAHRWKALLGVAVLAARYTVATSALAQSQPSPSAQPASFDTGRGPINGSTRFIGLGGAFVAIAEDSEGVAINPSSTAVRLPYSWSEWDYGLGVDVAIGAWLPKNNFYNQPSDNGATGGSTSLFGSIAADIFYNHFGLGISAEAQRNAATRKDQVLGISSSLGANFGIVHLNAAYGFWDGQLALGAGPRFIGLSFDRHSSSGLLSSSGVGYEAGFILKPAASQYRAAVAIKSPINATLPGSTGGPASTVHVPWEASFGFAYQLGAPPLNPRFVTARSVALQNTRGREPTKAELKSAEDELFDRYEKAERFYVLISSELTVIEGGGQAGLGDFLTDEQHELLSGAIYSPRLGVESEVVPHILRLRAGSYYEPPTLHGVRGRFHGTGGLDVRLFEWNVFGLIGRFDYWSLSLAADAARQYLNTAISIGFWH
jgi:hypothetical protein